MSLTNTAEPYPLCLERRLGATVSDDGAQFALWAPTASQVTLRLFAHGTDGEPGSRALGEYRMHPETDGSWTIDVPGATHGVYYDYLIEFEDGSVTRSADPWARAAGANGRRSMVVDLSRTDPDGWDADKRPGTPIDSDVIWETHIGDFSNDPSSGVPAEHRGKYLAFTDSGTTLDGEGAFPTCVEYLKRLGITVVQLLPFYDYGSVDETRSGGYNWGYDPVNYNVPEGSYATDPYDGEVRIRECKAMIQALHAAGIKVVMDVVYNHMYTTDNWFERVVPGYFCRRTDDGAFANGSGCGCDMATEHEMFRRFMVESVTYWASEYHLDGFRFDLMGLIDVETMRAIRASLDALPGGRSILMYGEPWAAGESAPLPGTILADKRALLLLESRIGHFCDTTRDAIKGHVFYRDQPGYVNGAAQQNRQAVLDAVNAHRTARVSEGNAGQIIQYVSAHDDLTLWDKLSISMRGNGTDHLASNAMYDDVLDGAAAAKEVLNANLLAAGIIGVSAGLPFMLAGEEFARTKHGNDNSFESGSRINELDWHRASDMRGLVRFYADLIALRTGDKAWFDAERIVVPTESSMIAFLVGKHAVLINPDVRERTMPLTVMNQAVARCDAGRFGDAAPIWRCTLDSTSDRYAVAASDTQSETKNVRQAGAGACALDDAGFHLAARSLSIWTREVHDGQTI
ncbi:pullulanase [Bifidobacterium sp. DSM 109960]|uniref:Pullulanase n=1 Tax=Bifidobacterium erythrocebi TaxID=2675325 RepID=A0A7Y0HV22_9BIFI|nr:type I pullulanase [Bifidobacterium sp. DSM 109960]NMM95762.1 pullulanase [Bifidobacterium sp. DSM 109960]